MLSRGLRWPAQWGKPESGGCEGEDPSSGIQNHPSQESKARDASEGDEGHCSPSEEEIRDAAFSGGVQEAAEEGRRNHDRRLDEAQHGGRCTGNLACPHRPALRTPLSPASLKHRACPEWVLRKQALEETVMRDRREEEREKRERAIE